MIQSFYKTSTITVSAYNPIILGTNYIDSLDELISSYTHVISVDGGFVSANININANPNIASDWLINGLGRHIVVSGAGGAIVWEGFVDRISVNLGNITIERGPLTEICNRCSVLYTPFTEYDSSGNPITGTQISSLIADDEDSKRKYGIWEKVISGGTLYDERDPVTGTLPAEVLRDTYLQDHKEPEISHSPILVSDSAGDVVITIDCKGYINWLSWIYMNLIEAPFTTDLTTKIQTVLADDPNSIFSTSLLHIDYNGVLIGLPEDQSRTAKEVIDECVGMGAWDYNRWSFGIYENRTAHFHAFSNTIDYLYYMSGGNQRILNTDETYVEPWNVRPGKLIFIPDTLFGGKLPISDFRTDPRIMFLEEVTFTAPSTLNLVGKKVHNFEQMMAQFGLSGGF